MKTGTAGHPEGAEVNCERFAVEKNAKSFKSFVVTVSERFGKRAARKPEHRNDASPGCTRATAKDKSAILRVPNLNMIL